ncbi:hypothetical protein [Microbacterium sp. A1-JK]|uniref:hypothetical protein n=1 Tax=Microbacterium sp. A1-JK TaxID=3177516 RepID=UPI0038899B09
MSITAKPDRELAEVIRRNAQLLGMSFGDYIVNLAATQLGMHDHAPQPVRTLDTLESLSVEDSPTAPASGSVASITTMKHQELQTRIAS